jgi:hypothetical protein
MSETQTVIHDEAEVAREMSEVLPIIHEEEELRIELPMAPLELAEIHRLLAEEEIHVKFESTVDELVSTAFENYPQPEEQLENQQPEPVPQPQQVRFSQLDRFLGGRKFF